MINIATRIFLVAALVLPLPASAHVPSVVDTSAAVAIENPEVSQAFYGEMDGEPVIYTIVSDREFELYASLLLPDLRDVDTTLQLQVMRDGEELYEALGEDVTWTRYWEEHAGDWYLKGLEVAREESGNRYQHAAGHVLPPGEYTLVVSNSANTGKYVLVVGNRERFGPAEIVQTIYNLPKVKIFFEKSPLRAFETPTTLGFLGILVIVSLVLLLVVRFVWKRFRRER